MCGCSDHRVEAEDAMGVEIRSCASVEEVRQAITPIGYYFGRSAPAENQAERLIRTLPAERVYAAWEGDRAVGGLGAFPFRLTVPGGRVPAAGITVAGVLPTHRRRGLLRAMMRALLDACHQGGEPVAYLWATEDTIYGRFGFGLASFTAEIDLPRERAAFHAPLAACGHVRLVSPVLPRNTSPRSTNGWPRRRRACSSEARLGGRTARSRIRIGGAAAAESCNAPSSKTKDGLPLTLSIE